MLPFIAKRLGSAILVLFIVMVMSFTLLHLTPGDPARVAAGPDADDAMVAATRERLGLNESLFAQFFNWSGDLLTGDIGTSYIQNRPVLDIILERVSVTASLVLLSLVFALIIAIPLGVIAATKRGRLADRISVVGSSLGIAVPEFFLGLLLVLGLALALPIFPATGYVPFGESPVSWFEHLVLPAITIGTTVAAELTRHVRASLSDVLELDYVRTAQAKGLGRTSVIYKHAFRNAALPVMTVFGLQVARLIGSTVIVEQIFALPGIGQLLVQSIFQRDLPVILGIGVFSAFLILVVNVLVDISYGWLSPKVRT